MNEDQQILELINKCLKSIDSSSEMHKDLFINNVRCLMQLREGRKFTEEKFKSIQNTNYYDYGRYK